MKMPGSFSFHFHFDDGFSFQICKAIFVNYLAKLRNRHFPYLRVSNIFLLGNHKHGEGFVISTMRSEESDALFIGLNTECSSEFRKNLGEI